jgi:thymidylate synthase (FAD)
MSRIERTTVRHLNDILGIEIPVLDHGFIRVIDYMGNDDSIVQAARVSYGLGTKHTLQDRALIRHLMRNRHTSPFEMCELKLHIRLPIFVSRQWQRHRSASINEYSARYSEVPDRAYIPELGDLRPQSKTNKQGRDPEPLPAEIAEELQASMKSNAKSSYESYKRSLDAGLARELARIDLPTNYYTEFYWKIDLHNLFNFIRLRAASNAQPEIRVYAESIMEIVKGWVPMAFEAFHDYVFKAASLSEKQLEVTKQLLREESVSLETSGLSRSEWKELMVMLGMSPSP